MTAVYYTYFKGFNDLKSFENSLTDADVIKVTKNVNQSLDCAVA